MSDQFEERAVLDGVEAVLNAVEAVVVGNDGTLVAEDQTAMSVNEAGPVNDLAVAANVVAANVVAANVVAANVGTANVVAANEAIEVENASESVASCSFSGQVDSLVQTVRDRIHNIWNESSNIVPPLKDYEIAIIPTVSVSSMEKISQLQCAICLEDFHLYERVSQLSCHHKYHKGCIVQWLKLHAICPICCKILVSEREVGAGGDDPNSGGGGGGGGGGDADGNYQLRAVPPVGN